MLEATGPGRSATWSTSRLPLEREQWMSSRLVAWGAPGTGEQTAGGVPVSSMTHGVLTEGARVAFIGTEQAVGGAQRHGLVREAPATGTMVRRQGPTASASDYRNAYWYATDSAGRMWGEWRLRRGGQPAGARPRLRAHVLPDALPGTHRRASRSGALNDARPAH